MKWQRVLGRRRNRRSQAGKPPFTIRCMHRLLQNSGQVFPLVKFLMIWGRGSVCWLLMCLAEHWSAGAPVGLPLRTVGNKAADESDPKKQDGGWGMCVTVRDCAWLFSVCVCVCGNVTEGAHFPCWQPKTDFLNGRELHLNPNQTWSDFFFSQWTKQSVAILQLTWWKQ